MNPDKSYRKLQSLLYTSGLGVILFSAWNAIKSLLDLIENASQYTSELAGLSLVIYYFMIVFILLTIVGFSYYIGRSAMAVARGKKKTFYLVLATISLVIMVSTTVYELQLLGSTNTGLLEFVITIILDVTTDIITLELIIFSILLKWKGRAKK